MRQRREAGLQMLSTFSGLLSLPFSLGLWHPPLLLPQEIPDGRRQRRQSAAATETPSSGAPLTDDMPPPPPTRP